MREDDNNIVKTITTNLFLNPKYGRDWIFGNELRACNSASQSPGHLYEVQK